MRAGHHGCQRLRAAHAAQPGCEDPLARPIAAVMLAPKLHKSFVRALHNPLRPNINPRAGGHLAVHHQALAVQLMKVLPRGPLGNEVGVGQQYTRRVCVRAQYGHRLAALHQQRFVCVQVAQCSQDRIIAFPVARRLAKAAVHHQVLRALGHIRIQVVLQHAVRRFNQPVFAGERGAARRAHRARTAGGCVCAGGFGHGCC